MKSKYTLIEFSYKLSRSLPICPSFSSTSSLSPLITLISLLSETTAGDNGGSTTVESGLAEVARLVEELAARVEIFDLCDSPLKNQYY